MSLPGFPVIAEAISDLRGLPREVRRSPWMIALILLTLGVGLGAATAVYSVVEALLLSPLPYPEAERLVQIHSERDGVPGRMSMADLRSIEETDLFEGVAAHTEDGGGYTMSDGEGAPHEAAAILVTANLFEVLGVPPVHGSTWPSTYDRERAYGVVLGHDLFQSRFGGDREHVGTSIRLDGAPGYEIHGVMGPDLDYPRRTELYRSIYINETIPGLTDRSSRRVRGLARLRAGVSVVEAQRVVDQVAARLGAGEPETNRGVSFRLTPLRDWYVGDTVPHLILMGFAALLLLALAVANASNLLLARAFTREGELAMRLALGAPRSRLLRLLVLEGALIAAAAAVLGWLVARAGVSLVVSMIRLDLPTWMVVDVDRGALVVALFAALLVGAVAATVPATRLFRRTSLHLARTGVRGDGSRGRSLSRALVSGEVALAVAVMTVGFSVTRGLRELSRTELGFDATRVLTFKVNLPWYLYNGDNPKIYAFHREVLQGLEALPGAVSATSSTGLPLTGAESTGEVRLVRETAGQQDLDEAPPIAWSLVDPGYFETMEIPVVAGRSFRETDDTRGEPVAVLSSDLAARFWSGEDAIGRLVRAADRARWPFLDQTFRVVGVVPPVRHDPRQPTVREVYLAATQFPAENVHFAARFQDPVTPDRVQAAEAVVWSVDPVQPIWDVHTLEDRRNDLVWRERIVVTLVSVFSVLGLVLSASGVFGVVSFSAAQRRREIGLASALGAGGSRIVLAEMRRAWRMIWPGLGVGVLSGAAATVAGASLLPSMARWEVGVGVGAVAILAVVAILSALAPSLRAARVDPMVALRKET